MIKIVPGEDYYFFRGSSTLAASIANAGPGDMILLMPGDVIKVFRAAGEMDALYDLRQEAAHGRTEA